MLTKKEAYDLKYRIQLLNSLPGGIGNEDINKVIDNFTEKTKKIFKIPGMAYYGYFSNDMCEVIIKDIQNKVNEIIDVMNNERDENVN